MSGWGDEPAAETGNWGDKPAAETGGWADEPASGFDSAPVKDSRGSGWADAPADEPRGGRRNGGHRDRDDGYGDRRHDDRGDRRRRDDDGGFSDRSPVRAENKYASKAGYDDIEVPQAAARTYERNPRLEKELFGDPNVARPSSGINFDKYDQIPVSVKGKDIPPELESFDDANLPEALQLNIKLSRYTKPTPVQRYGIPVALQGRDLMSCAQTGSGKTAAFLLPVLKFIMELPEYQPSSRIQSLKALPRALIMAPTRELAIQIFEEARKFCYMTGLTAVVVYGGRPAREQISQLKRGCDVVVATPGRLTDLCDRGVISFEACKFLILDEADRMLDMGFEPQIRRLVERYDMPTEDRQTLMFSATFPREIRDLARDFLREYVFLTIGRVGSTTDNISQKVMEVDDYEKSNKLMSVLLECDGLTLIFVQTKVTADTLEDSLSECGINAVAIHGDRTQSDREFAMRQFKSGRAPILVATDVAARGWDIPNVKYVINYDLPQNIDDYVHRIGRTGRAGNTGTAISFFTGKNMGLSSDLIGILEESGQEVPAFLGGRSRGGYGGHANAEAPADWDNGAAAAEDGWGANDDGPAW